MALQKRIGRFQYHVDRLVNLLANRTSGRRVIFLHIPKCAGSSINLLFKCYYGSGRSKRLAAINDRERGPHYLEKIMRARDALFVHGHFGFETLEQIRDEAFVFTVLRDPFERLRSTYGHLRTRTKGNPLKERVLEMALGEFLASREEDILQWTDNVMARMLAARFDLASAYGMERGKLAELAISHLKTFDYVGFVDTFGSNLSRIAAIAGLPVPKTTIRENVTIKKAGITPTQQSVAPFDAAARQLALPRVEADLALYAAACLRARHQNGPSCDN
jgi:hypothetical protein